MLTRFTRNAGTYSRTWEKRLPLPRLVGMTSDGKGGFYVAAVVAENLATELTTVTYRPNVLVMAKYDDAGNEVWQRDLNSAEYLGDAGESSTATAVFSPLTAGSGALAYGAGKIIVTLASNTLPDPNISQRHQRAQYFAVGEDGAGFKSASETSWRHSFDQRLLFDGNDFVFVDIGDAGWYMPGAGVALRKIEPIPSGANFVGQPFGVYAYMRQGETAGSQNFSFTSLGDIAVGSQGYVVLFSSEKTNPGPTPRSGWDQPVAEPRNVGLVHVTQGFSSVLEGDWDGQQILGNTIIKNGQPVSTTIKSTVVDSPGASATFTRVDKPDKSFTQTGIVWLTDLPAGVSAERPKLIKLDGNNYIVAWEEWSYNGTQLDYQSTKAMVVNEQGGQVRAATAINARLNPSGADHPFVLDGRAAWVASNGGKLSVYSLDVSLALTTAELGATMQTPETPPPPPTMTAPTMTMEQPTTSVTLHEIMSVDDNLLPNDKLVSANGKFTLLYQFDGNLVLYAEDGAALWASNTNGSSVGRATFQADGNFVIYGANEVFVWNSGTVSPGSILFMQDDGNLVIYDQNMNPIWATNTVR